MPSDHKNAAEQLQEALVNKDIGMLRKSIEAGDHLKYKPGGCPAIYFAVINEFDEGVDLLIENGMSPSEPTDTNSLTPGTTALHHVAGLPHRIVMLKHLIELGADVNAKDKYGVMPLRMASMLDNPEGAAALRAAGATTSGIKAQTDQTRRQIRHSDDDPGELGR